MVRPDKANSIVVLDWSVYFNKMLEIVKNTNKFKSLKVHPTFLRGGKLQWLLHKVKDKCYFNESEYEDIYRKVF